ncbi:hypothetical protein F5B20DRAFT_360106 [Whalleya microplaca]|nr:hypothetical protein F5B20DRAFT_360106 [Whalleya microplaca]
MSLAQAVTKDGFAFAGDLFAEASGHNRHRRATPAELKEHFKNGSDKDRPAHWFEAQLIHYGLQPSKTKSVARMRLYDAVNAGKLSVPSHIQKLESDLKKEWTKKEREAKKALKEPSSSSKAKGTKRKADASNVDLTVNVGGVNITVSASNSSSQTASATKKAKTTKPTATPKSTAAPKAVKKEPKPKAPKKEPKPKAPKTEPKSKAPKTATPKSTPKPTPKASTSGPKSSSSSQKPPASTTKKQTARRGGISQGPSRGGGKTASPRPPRTKQTARRGGSTAARGRVAAPAPARNVIDLDGDDGFDYGGPPPPYSEYADDGPQDDYYGDSYGSYGYSDDDDQDDSSDTDLRPLGLLNGRYDLESQYVTSEWGDTDFSLVLTLSGRELWGQFDLGVVSGILRFHERPWESSDEPVDFQWRGREREGPIIYGNDNNGSIRFLGDGRIEGELDFMSIEFRGRRRSNQGTRSEVEAGAMRYEWDGYNEDVYEEEERSRWY